MDRISAVKRSELMSKVKSKDTKTELLVRKVLRSVRLGYRLHRRDLPGKPDIVFSKIKKIIFVHGCFWHLHENCRKSKKPASNKEFWEKKLTRNQTRDKKIKQLLSDAGWDVLIIWECEINDFDILRERIKSFLNDDASKGIVSNLQGSK